MKRSVKAGRRADLRWSGAVPMLLLVAAICACGRPDPGTEGGKAPPAASETSVTPDPSHEEAPGPPDGTAAMVERLARYSREADADRNIYLNDRRVASIEARLPELEGMEALQMLIRLGIEATRAGQTEKGIEAFEAAVSIIQEYEIRVAPKQMARLQLDRVTAYLRKGEQDNCLEQHNPDSCLMPISGGGVHTDQTGSRRAIELLEAQLEAWPDSLELQWLLNLAAMTVGEYPDGVSRKWLLPPDLFTSERDVGRFPDIASHLGVAVPDLSGGAVLEDLDGDTDLDILCSSWGLDDQIRLFTNEGDGTFRDRTRASGLWGITGGLNMVHADYDNDGDADVLVLRGAWLGLEGQAPNSLLRNEGDGRFADVTLAAGLASERPTQNAAWGDYDNDGWVDLFIGNESRPGGGRFPCELYRNRGDGTFEELAASVGLDVAGFVKGSAWGDYDDDGRIDLYVSVMGGENRLFHNEGPTGDGGWSFRDVAAEAGVTEPISSFPLWFWDYDNDGRLDLYVLSWSDTCNSSRPGQALADVVSTYLGRSGPCDTPRLYRNRGDGTFEDTTREAGLDTPRLAMGSNTGDIDNDGFPDAYIGNGTPDLHALVPNRLFRNDGGERFQDVTTSADVGQLQKGHGVAFGDIDNDGDQDIYEVLGGAYTGDTYPNALFLNPGHGNHWITLRLRGVRSNRSAIGARIEVVLRTPDGRRSVHALAGTGGSFGSSSLQQEIGLGRAEAIEVLRIRWPAGGEVQVFREVEMDRMLLITEGEDEPVYRTLQPIDFMSSAPSASPPHHH